MVAEAFYENYPGHERENPPERRVMLHDPAYREMHARLAAYDGTEPEAEHLRTRQHFAAQAFCDIGSKMLDGTIPLQRMSVIHPTGSGKTVFASELIRIAASGERGSNTIMLVPSLRIMSQTIGSADDAGDIRSYNPGMSVGMYTGEIKTTHNRVTVMNYHMLKHAIESGDWARINPKLVIADEIHHLIDGTWAGEFDAITQDILSVGLTATPVYAEGRDARGLFPVVLDHMTMREGIESGILSDFQGFMYQGSSKIKIQRYDGDDYTDDDVFRAVIGSKDNYLAAAICAREVAQGRRGIVSCVPGHDRLHAKVMAKILSQTDVETPDGARKISAAYVDSDMPVDELEDVLHRYHKKDPEIDVVTFVSLLLEGWNSPPTDFGVWLRPTPSNVLAEQRMGRLLRRRIGKVATVHEILYEVENERTAKQQITHVDVLNNVAARRHAVGKLHVGQRNRSNYKPLVDASLLDLNEDVSSQIAAQNPVADKDIQVSAESDGVPYGWSTLHILATRFGISRKDAEKIVADSEVEVMYDNEGTRVRKFYSPDANTIIAAHLEIELEVPEHETTMMDIIDYCRYSDLSMIVTPEEAVAHLDAKGFSPTRCLIEDKVVFTYPEDIYDHMDDIEGVKAPKVRKKKYERREPQAEVLKWLASNLVNPKDAATKAMRRNILVAQTCLINALRSGPLPTNLDQDRISREIAQLEITPNQQMLNVMASQKIDLIRLIVAATAAREEWAKLTS